MTIEAVAYGEIVLQGKTYYSDVVVWWNGRKALLEKTHIIDLTLLERILKPKPEALVIGVGLEGSVRILPEVREQLKKRGIKLFMDKTRNAVDIYNGLLAQGKKAVAIMHVTL